MSFLSILAFPIFICHFPLFAGNVFQSNDFDDSSTSQPKLSSEVSSSSNSSDIDENAPETSSSNQNGNLLQSSSTMSNSNFSGMTVSNLSYDTEEMMCEEKDDENLENLRRKVSLIIDIASNTSSNSSSNTTIVNKKFNSKNEFFKGSEGCENNNNVIDSDEETDKKFTYSARTKRFV